MSGGRPIGYTIERFWCRSCVPEGIIDSGYEPLREGDDHGIPYYCDDCGEPLLPCDHEWDEWRPAFRGINNDALYHEIRFCTKYDCEEADYR